MFGKASRTFGLTIGTSTLRSATGAGTIRTVTSEHQLVKLRAYSSVDYDG